MTNANNLRDFGGPSLGRGIKKWFVEKNFWGNFRVRKENCRKNDTYIYNWRLFFFPEHGTNLDSRNRA